MSARERQRPKSVTLPPVSPTRTAIGRSIYATSASARSARSPPIVRYPAREDSAAVDYELFTYRNQRQWNKRHTHTPWSRTQPSYHPIVIKNDDPNATKAPRKRPQFRKTPFKVGSRCVLEDGRSGVVKWIGRIDGTGKRSNDPDIGLQLDDAGGEHDGTVNNRRYFQCRMWHGTVCRGRDVRFYMNRNQAEYTPIEEDEKINLYTSRGERVGTAKDLRKTAAERYSDLHQTLLEAQELGRQEQEKLDTALLHAERLSRVPDREEIMAWST